MKIALALGALVCGGVSMAAVAPPPPPAVVLHVAADGADANAGTAAAPFATLERARDALRDLQRGGSGLPGPAVVLVRGGVYRLPRPLVFTPADSGTAVAPVTYAAAPGERPVLSGGQLVTGWRRHDDRLWVAEVPWAKGRRVPLSQVFVNGVRRPRARTPNAGQYAYSKRLTLTPGEHPQCLGLSFVPGDLQPWAVPDERVVCLFHNWVNSYNYVKAADWERGRLSFARPAGIFFLGPHVRYYVENAFEYLDEPGEWYLDPVQARLFYYPTPAEDMARAEVVAPALVQTLVKVVGAPELGLFVEHLVFRGLSFQHSDADLSRDYAHSVQGAHTQKGAFLAVGMRHSVIEDCEFTRLGEHALSLHEACAWNTVQRCHAHDLGGGGVYLSEGAPDRPDEARLTAHNLVDNNFIHDGGHLVRAACGVFLGGSASHNRITHNEICDLSWMGVHLGWSWTGKAPAYTHHNEVAYNHIHHIGNGVLNDIGGIYTLGVSPGTILHHNLIHDVSRFERGREGYGGWGIYLDAGSSELRVEHNVVYDTRDGGLHVHNHGHPYGNLIVNNIFAFAEDAQWMRNADHEPEGNHVHLERNLVYNHHAKMLGGSNWKDGSKFTAERNCYWSETTATPNFGGRTFAAWQAGGRDQHALVADPRFVDAAARDFRLRPDSPALALGFQPIDLAAVGLHGPQAWRDLPKHVTHRRIEAAVAPATNPGAFEDDFEEYEVGATPDGGVAPEGVASVRVTDLDPASGRQCLVFTDGPGVTVWKPHWFCRRTAGSGQVRLSCAVRLDPAQPAQADLEGRDWDMSGGNVTYATGPLLRFLPDGSVHAAAAGDKGGWLPLARFPLGTWLRVEIDLEEGVGKPKTYVARLGPLAADLQAWPGLPFRDAAFTGCTWVGFAGLGETAGTFYVDDVRVR